MFTDQIEKLKNQYTDRYVVVDSSRPELARFRDVTGRIKTVNMSGRALVEFMDYHLNIGWYDIALEFLKVVDKPLPKVEKPKPEKKPVPPKAVAKPAEAKAPEAKPAAAKPAAAGKMSVADMLAAARGKKASAGPTPSAEPKAAATKPKAVPAAAPAEPVAKVDREKLSVADMLAAARGEKSGGAAAPATKTPEASEPEAAAAPPEESPQSTAEPPAPGIVKIDRSTMSVADMLAYARQSDGQK